MAPCVLRLSQFAPAEARETYTATFRLVPVRVAGRPPDWTQKRATLVVRFTSADWVDYAPDLPAEHPAALASWILMGPGVRGYRARYGV